MAATHHTGQFFISYAREDKAFAVALRRKLAAVGRLAWLDLKNIGALAPWRKEIAAAIDAADVFVFILSPDAVASAACRKELQLAVDAKKRLAPLVWRDTDAKSVPAALRAPNWLFVRGRESIDALVQRLVNAANRDPDWLRDHTRLLTRAREWQQHRRDPSRLLGGQGLQDALRWLAGSGGRRDRIVSRLQADFIETSRAADSAAAARQREMYLKALSRQLAAQSELTRGSTEYAVETPALLAIESLLRWPTVEGDRALRRSLALVPRPAIARHEHARDAVVSMSLDGTVLVSGVHTVLRLIEVSSGSTLWRVRLGVHAERVEFGPGETTIVVHTREHVIQVHDRGNGARLGRIQPGSPITAVVVHPEGTAIAAADSATQRGRVRVWRLGSDAEPFTVDLQREPAALALVDNFLVAVDGAPSPMGHTRVVAWQIGSTDPPRVLWELYGRVLNAEIAEDGTWVAITVFAFGAGQPTAVSVGALALRLANPEAAETMNHLSHDEPVDRIRRDGLGRLLSFTHKGTAVHVWEPAISRLVGRYRVSGHAYDAALAGGGKWLAVASHTQERHAVSHVSLVTDDGVPVFSTPIADRVAGLACDEDGRITVSTARSISVWDADTGSAVRQLRAKSFSSLVFSADSTCLLVDAVEDGTLVVPIDRSRAIVHLEQAGSVWTSAFVGADAGQVVTIGNPSFGTDPKGDSHLRVWNVASAAPIQMRRRVPLTPVALTGNGRVMATLGQDGAVLVRPVAAAGRARRFLPNAKVTTLLFNEDDTHLAAVMEDSVQMWRLADAALVATLEIGERQSLRAFDPAKGLAVLSFHGGYDSVGSIIRLESGHPIVDHMHRLNVDFRRERFAAVIGEGKIEVRDLSKGKLLMKAFHEYVNGLELAPDGTHVVSSGSDNSARVWQLADGAELARLEHPDRVLRAHFSPDSRFVATVCSDDIVRVWTWRAADLVAEGRRRVQRSLTDAELDSFLPDPETRR